MHVIEERIDDVCMHAHGVKCNLSTSQYCNPPFSPHAYDLLEID